MCQDLGIQHYVLDLTEDFSEKVMDYFVEEYMQGEHRILVWFAIDILNLESYWILF